MTLQRWVKRNQASRFMHVKAPKKLIQVALPLDDINAAAAWGNSCSWRNIVADDELMMPAACARKGNGCSCIASGGSRLRLRCRMNAEQSRRVSLVERCGSLWHARRFAII